MPATTGRRLLAGVGVAALLIAGFYLLARNVGEGPTSLAIGIGWCVLVAAAALALARGRPGLMAPVLAALLAAGLAVGVYAYPRGTEVDEQIVTAEPAEASSEAGATDGRASEAERREVRRDLEIASAPFEGVSGHSGSGEAAVIELAEGGRALTFSDFDVDPGAGGMDLRIYVAAGEPQSDAEVSDFVELGPLRGTRGDQQYELPRDVDLDRYGSVVIWCVPFTTRIAQADL